MKEAVEQISVALALAKKKSYAVNYDLGSKPFIIVPVEDYAMLIEELELDPITTETIHLNGCEIIASIDDETE